MGTSRSELIRLPTLEKTYCTRSPVHDRFSRLRYAVRRVGDFRGGASRASRSARMIMADIALFSADHSGVSNSFAAVLARIPPPEASPTLGYGTAAPLTIWHDIAPDALSSTECIATTVRIQGQAQSIFAESWAVERRQILSEQQAIVDQQRAMISRQAKMLAKTQIDVSKFSLREEPQWYEERTDEEKRDCLRDTFLDGMPWHLRRGKQCLQSGR